MENVTNDKKENITSLLLLLGVFATKLDEVIATLDRIEKNGVPVKR